MLDMMKELSETAGQVPQDSEEDSDVAPMSPLVDAPTPAELQAKALKAAEKSVKLASSASESESDRDLASKKGAQKKSVRFTSDTK